MVLAYKAKDSLSVFFLVLNDIIAVDSVDSVEAAREVGQGYLYCPEHYTELYSLAHYSRYWCQVISLFEMSYHGSTSHRQYMALACTACSAAVLPMQRTLQHVAFQDGLQLPGP